MGSFTIHITNNNQLMEIKWMEFVRIKFEKYWMTLHVTSIEFNCFEFWCHDTKNVIKENLVILFPNVILLHGAIWPNFVS
jgi:hypothetical protein